MNMEMLSNSAAKVHKYLIGYSSASLGLSLFTGLDYWTGILDWTTGLKFFPFLDKNMWFFKYLTPGDLNYYFVILQQQYNDFMTVVVLLAFSNALANKLMIMTSQGII